MKLQSAESLGFVDGGLYSRRLDVHERFGGQRQGGISTPKEHPYIFAFTGEVGRSHGYHDFWDTEGLFHYYGEGQVGDMRYTGGNRAIVRHQEDGKRLFVFRMLGHGKPYRYEGEFSLVRVEEQSGALSKGGSTRTAIVFVLKLVQDTDDNDAFEPLKLGEIPALYAGKPTSRPAMVQVRTQQSLFRRRVSDLEKGCRLTGVCDLRFLRASHVKPWVKCETDNERIDGNNGLLLCPQADLLFDRGWISFEDSGALVRSSELPRDVVAKIGLNLKIGRKCGTFLPAQQAYLDFHRKEVFGKRYSQLKDPLGELLIAID